MFSNLSLRQSFSARAMVDEYLHGTHQYFFLSSGVVGRIFCQFGGGTLGDMCSDSIDHGGTGFAVCLECRGLGLKWVGIPVGHDGALVLGAKAISRCTLVGRVIESGRNIRFCQTRCVVAARAGVTVCRASVYLEIA